MAQRIDPTSLFPNLRKLGSVTTPFGGKTDQEGFHPAVDIANAKGTRVPAFAGGIVTDVDYGHQKGENNFGNSVIITDAQGNKHRYSHLNKGYVSVGDQVNPKQILGEMGDSGATYSPSGGDSTNLDYRIVSAYGKYKNPMTYISRFLKNE